MFTNRVYFVYGIWSEERGAGWLQGFHKASYSFVREICMRCAWKWMSEWACPISKSTARKVFVCGVISQIYTSCKKTHNINDNQVHDMTTGTLEITCIHMKTCVYLLTVTYLCVFPIYIYLLKLVLCVYFQALSPRQCNPLNLRHTTKFQLTADKNTLSIAACLQSLTFLSLSKGRYVS